ncbi:unnamed protein product [Lota lota]
MKAREAAMITPANGVSRRLMAGRVGSISPSPPASSTLPSVSSPWQQQVIAANRHHRRLPDSAPPLRANLRHPHPSACAQMLLAKRAPGPCAHVLRMARSIAAP